MWLPHGAFFFQVVLSVNVRFLSERKRRKNLPGAEVFCKADGELLAHVGEKNGYSATQKRNRSPRQGIIKFPGEPRLRGILYREKDCRQTGDGVPAHCRKESDFRLATMIPGIVMMIAFCVWSYFKFKKDPNIIIEPAVAKGKCLSHAAKVTWKSLPALFFPIFVLGAIYGGICTPSEAAAVSVFYAAFVGLFVYKKINFKDCVQIFVKTCCTAGVCGFMVFCVSMVSRIFMVENLNGVVEALLNAMGGNRYVILLCVNILLILFGMFLDDSSAMYICAPILTPVLANFGIDPVHFAAIMIVNLGLGCITPPCASVLFMGARVGKSSLTKMLPSTYSLILFVWLPMLAILTLFPDVALWLPRVMLGYGA